MSKSADTSADTSSLKRLRRKLLVEPHDTLPYKFEACVYLVAVLAQLHDPQPVPVLLKRAPDVKQVIHFHDGATYSLAVYGILTH